MNMPPTKTPYSGGNGLGKSVLTAWKAWVALNTNELSWIALAGSAVVLAGLYTRW